MAFDLTVNRTVYHVDADAQTPLLWVIREHIGLTGAKFSCGIGQCGACTLHIDGRPVRSCSVPASTCCRQTGAHDRGGSRLTEVIPLQITWDGVRRATVRLLPVRHDHERTRAAAASDHFFATDQYRRAGHERLSLWHLSPRPAGHPPAPPVLMKAQP